MEKFGYTKAWKIAKFLECGYPIAGLLGVAAYGLFIVIPTRDSAYRYEFQWWVPLFVIGLIIWAILEIRKFRKCLGYSVEVSDESIRVLGKEARWDDVSRIEMREGGGNNPAILLYTKAGMEIVVVGATAGIQYIKGFIEGHAKNASRI